MFTGSDIKAALREAGLPVYRVTGEAVHVAERVRDNLILDSGAQIEMSPPAVVFRVCAQASAHPGADAEVLFAKARQAADAAEERGFVERSAEVVPIPDPNDPDRALDQSHEVAYAHPVETLEEAVELVRWALTIDRSQ